MLPLCFLGFVIFLCFAQETCGILGPQPEIKPTLYGLEGKVLTTGPTRQVPRNISCLQNIGTRASLLSQFLSISHLLWVGSLAFPGRELLVEPASKACSDKWTRPADRYQAGPACSRGFSPSVTFSELVR